ncbi:MAG: hypothetical protein HND44_18870 [Chloroflexi bacterium]|nr:hypothetical protein [Ardenticatenaceae bacterium]MBL1130519.1 hypothetical protein [Chloroflexota bacterium]NOG36609.1 hypothetical protein [Chloroflexota bacterium]
MEHYTRTTIIQPHMKIRRERVLPQSGEMIVKIGTEVSPGQIVARTPLQTVFAIVDAGQILDVSPEKVNALMEVENNAAVDEGTVLAKKKGLRARQVLSPVAGKLYDVINGRIFIQQTAEWVETPALVSGKVVSHVGDRGVVIETYGAFIQGIWGSRKENHGKLKIISRSNNGFLAKDQLTDDVNKHILAVGRLEHIEVLHLAQEMAVAGIIAGSMTADLCDAAYQLNYPIILTDGVGKQSMSPIIFNLLQQVEGRETSLFANYDASRGQRPEIIIPEPATPSSEAVQANKPLQIGQKVRLLRAPFVGQTGEVAEIFTLSQLLATGAKAPGANIRLADGQVVFTPFANVDVII